MSFNDLSDLEDQSGSFAPSTASPGFTRLSKSISQRIFSITSNVALIHRFIGLLGTTRDTDKMRSSLMDTLAKTKDLSKDLVPDIRTLTHWDPDEIGPSERYEQQKLTGDFQKAATDFQNAQRLALEKQKDFVSKRREAIEEEQAEYEASPDGRGQRSKHSQQQQQQQGAQLLDNAEVEFNEQLIEEREQEIQGIEQGIIELNEIFRDLGSIVTEQGSLIGSNHPYCVQNLWNQTILRKMLRAWLKIQRQQAESSRLRVAIRRALARELVILCLYSALFLPSFFLLYPCPSISWLNLGAELGFGNGCHCINAQSTGVIIRLVSDLCGQYGELFRQEITELR